VARVENAPGPIPAPLLWAVRLLRAESVALALVAIFLVYKDLTAVATDLVSAIWVTGFAIAGAVVLWLLATALAGCRPGARAPAIVLQLMLLPVGYYMTQGGLAWLGVPLIALGVLVIGLIVSRPSTRAMGL